MAYPYDCPFCSSRLYSKHCLLPFEFTTRFSLPDDELSSIMELTQLHMEYGMHQLQSNFEFLHYITHSRTQSSASHSIPQSSQSNCQTFQPILDEIQLDHLDQGAKSEDTLRQESDGLRSTLAEILVSPHQEKQPVIRPLETLRNESLSLKGKEIDSTVNRPLNLTEEHSSTLETSFPPLSPNHLIHLTSDIIIAIATGYTMFSKRHVGKRTSELIKSLTLESSLRCHSNKPYRSQTSTPLDHPIALAREITGTHQKSQLLTWESGTKNIPDSTHCLLSHSLFNKENTDLQKNKLIPSLHIYARDAINSSRLQTSTRNSLLNMIKDSLIKRGFPFAYNWFLKYKPTLKSPTQSVSDHLETHAQPSSSKALTIQSKQLTEHKCPAFREETRLALDNGLEPSILTVLSETGPLDLTLPNDQSITNVLTSLITEIVKHKPTWNQPDSTVSLKDVQNSLNWTKTTLNSTDEPLILWIIVAILAKLRAYEPFRKTH